MENRSRIILENTPRGNSEYSTNIITKWGVIGFEHDADCCEYWEINLTPKKGLREEQLFITKEEWEKLQETDFPCEEEVILQFEDFELYVYNGDNGYFSCEMVEYEVTKEEILELGE